MLLYLIIYRLLRLFFTPMDKKEKKEIIQIFSGNKPKIACSKRGKLKGKKYLKKGNKYNGSDQ